MNRSLARTGRDVDENFSPTFSAEIATRLGVADRTVQLDVKRIEKIDSKIRGRIRERREIADNGQELDALAGMDKHDQKRALDLVAAGFAGAALCDRLALAMNQP